MDNKKISIKKSEATLFGVVLTILLVVGVFTGLFLYINYNAQQSGQAIDGTYNTTYSRLSDASGEVEDNIDEISTAAKGITEADSTWQVAWNGLRGLGSLLKLPISFVDSGQETLDAITIGTAIIPSWAVTLIRIGIIGLIVFIVISILKGDNNIIR